MENYCNEISNIIGSKLTGDEIFAAYFSGEDSDFCRINQSKVRQAGNVRQLSVAIQLINNNKQVSGHLTLSTEKNEDILRIVKLLSTLREQIDTVPEDPHLLYTEEVNSSESYHENKLSAAHEVIDHVREAADSSDVVGILAQGGIYRGFANSFGQRNWYENYNFNFDYSIYLRSDKAVKSGYAGTEYNKNDLTKSILKARQDLEILKRPPITIQPGKYRVFLAPAAIAELVEMLGWGGFGLKSHNTKQSCLQKMNDEGWTFSEMVSMMENTKDGIGPDFSVDGFKKPDVVTMIKNGMHNEYLVSPRSAKEFGVQTNGASSSETFNSFELSGGELSSHNELSALDTGIYINNLWYVNFSDRNSCRLTGMTRFASFWIENGEIKAPLNVMRFDESLFKALGENLVALTKDKIVIPSASTYGSRSTTSVTLPGALVNDFNFTL